MLILALSVNHFITNQVVLLKEGLIMNFYSSGNRANHAKPILMVMYVMVTEFVNIFGQKQMKVPFTKVLATQLFWD